MALFEGSVPLTVGAVVSAAAPVVNVQVKSAAAALPAKSAAPGVTVAVYAVFAARLAAGVKVAVVPT